MSNIYIQEPPTSGKVLLKTSVGDIDIELWAREAPKACRNFVQLCLEGYYDNTVFHRLVKGFIVQGGDPTGTGAGGESCYGTPFKDEFHSRLRFVRRGLLAMANAGKDDNGSQFFFTLGPAPELQNKHTIFGKVAGDTLYNMLRLEDGLVDQDERPVYPQKVLSTEVLTNPFPDIEPRSRALSVPATDGAEKKKDKRAAVKNFSLLSFGEEAEDDEQEAAAAARLLAARAPAGGKSAHDLLQDPQLSARPVVESERLSGDESGGGGGGDTAPQLDAGAVRSKLQRAPPTAGDKEPERKKRKTATEKEADAEEPAEKKSKSAGGGSAAEDGVGAAPEPETQESELARLRREYRELRSQLRAERQSRNRTEPGSAAGGKETAEEEAEAEGAVGEFRRQQQRYRALRSQLPRRGAGREDFTLQLLARFQQRLASAKEQQPDGDGGADADGSAAREAAARAEVRADAATDADDEADDEGWLTHRLQFDKGAPVLAKDASTKEDDWFEIYDPRNPINKRRREAGAGSGGGGGDAGAGGRQRK